MRADCRRGSIINQYAHPYHPEMNVFVERSLGRPKNSPGAWWMPLAYPQWKKSFASCCIHPQHLTESNRNQLCARGVLFVIRPSFRLLTITHVGISFISYHSPRCERFWCAFGTRYFLSEWIKNDSLTTLDYELYLPTKIFFNNFWRCCSLRACWQERTWQINPDATDASSRR